MLYHLVTILTPEIPYVSKITLFSPTCSLFSILYSYGFACPEHSYEQNHTILPFVIDFFHLVFSSFIYVVAALLIGT
jgi:hypothetical protein